MRIKIVMHELYLGGVENAIISLLKEYSELKFDLFLPKDGKNAQIKNLSDNVNVVFYNEKNNSFSQMILALKILLCKVNETDDYDVSIDYSGISPVTNFNLLKSKNKKYFVINSDVESYKKTASLLVKFKFVVFKFIAKKYHQKGNVIFVSETAKNQFEKFLGGEVNNGVVINSFVQPLNEERIVACNNSDVLKILFVGRLSPEKNIILLLNSILEIKKTTDKFHLSIVGDGVLYDEVRDFIFKNKLENYVTMFGRLEDISFHYGSNDVLVAPSLNEGQGLVLFEANQYTLPIIATKILPFEEFVDETRGRLVPFDPVIIAKTILNDLEDIRKLVVPIDIKKYNCDVKNKWDTILKEKN